MKIDLSQFVKASTNRPSGRSISSCGVTIRTVSLADNATEQTHISIGVDIMKGLRWVCGDRVSIYNNPKTCELVLVRNPDGEIMLTGSGKRKEYLGKLSTAKAKFCFRGSELSNKTMKKTIEYPHTITEDNMLVIDYKIEKVDRA